MGCQCFIDYNVFIDTINNPTETDQRSTDLYKTSIPVYEAIKSVLESNKS